MRKDVPKGLRKEVISPIMPFPFSSPAAPTPKYLRTAGSTVMATAGQVSPETRERERAFLLFLDHLSPQPLGFSIRYSHGKCRTEGTIKLWVSNQKGRKGRRGHGSIRESIRGIAERILKIFCLS